MTSHAEKPFKFGPKQERWLHMLETTRRKQGKTLLHGDEGYCCLGIAELSLGKTPSEIKGHALPGSSWFALGLKSGEGSSFQCNFDSCARMNDNKGMSFREIAKTLRANPRAYFTRPK